MAFIGYDARNTSVFDNAIWNGTRGTYVGFVWLIVSVNCSFN